MLEHERSCNFVPVGIVRQRIQELERRESKRRVPVKSMKVQSELASALLRMEDAEVQCLEAKIRNSSLSREHWSLEAENHLNLHPFDPK